MRPYKYSSNFFFEDSLRILKEGNVRVALLGGVDSAMAAEQAMDAGFEFVVMGRALLADPNFVNRIRSGEAVKKSLQSLQCVYWRNGFRRSKVHSRAFPLSIERYAGLRALHRIYTKLC